MGKATKKRRSAKIKAVHVPPEILQADIPAAQRARAVYEVVEVANPFGEVVHNGQMKRHRACRLVPRFKTLYRSAVIDDHVFACLEWYDARLGLAESGLFKCGLDASGGGGSAQCHIPTTQAAMEARSEIRWARGFVPADLVTVFDGVMVFGLSFAEIGAALYRNASPDQAARRASSAFKIAANHLLLGIGHRVGGGAFCA